MNQNFSKRKILHDSLILHDSFTLEHFQLGGGFGGTNLGGKHFGPLKSLGFQQLSYL